MIEIAEMSKFVCTAECLPSCRYVLSVDSQTVRGNVVEITVDHPLKSATIKCEAQNTVSRKTATALKTVRIKGRSTQNGIIHLGSAHVVACSFFRVSCV